MVQLGRRCGRWTLLLVCLCAGLSVGAGDARGAIYWGNGPPIGRANVDGTLASKSFVPTGPPIEATYVACGAVAVNESHVFWTDPARGAVGRANIDGSSPSYSFITGAANPCGIAVDGTHIYWANLDGDSIGRANLDGSEPDQTFVEGIEQPCGVAVNAASVYWGSSGPHYVGRADRQTGVPGPPLIVGSDDYGLCGIAVNQTHLFWGGFGSRIGRADLDGSNADPAFIDGVERPCGLAVDETHVYWSEQGVEDARVGRAHLDGSGVQTGLMTGLGSICGVALDGLRFEPATTALSSFRFGRVRHGLGKGVVHLAVDIPDAGHLVVTLSKGLSWRFVGEGVGPALGTGGRKWLRIAPARKGWEAHNIRRVLRNEGRLRFKVRIRYAELGKLPRVRSKSLTLLRGRAKGSPAAGPQRR